MGVRARSNDYVLNRLYTQGFVTETRVYYANGTMTTGNTAFNNRVHSCTRQNHTKNKRGPIQGSSSTFISPSSYERSVRDISWTRGYWKDTSFIPTAPTSVVMKESFSEPNDGGSLNWFNLPPIFNGGVALDTNIRNQCNVEALLKLADGKAELGVALAEARQTADMLGQSATQLFRLLRNVKRGNWGAIPKQFRLHFPRGKAKVPSNAYLQLHYGWMPLMSDIHSIYHLLRERMEPAMLLKAERNVRDSISLNDYPSGSNCTVTGSAKRCHTTKVWAKVDSTAIRQANQIGLANPASILWEVVPFSFVIDWGLPVGNVLAALSATNGLSFVGGYTAVRGEGKSKAHFLPTGSWEEVKPRMGQCEWFSYKRTRLTGFPKPLPYAVNPFSTSHVTTALALWVQNLLK